MRQIIKTQYGINIKPAWEFKKIISMEKWDINTSSSRGRFAYFKIKFEKGQFDVPIVLEMQSLFHKDSIPRENLREETMMYVNTIIRALEENIDQFYIKGYPIVNLKITLSEILIHPYNSNELSFKIATDLAMEEVLDLTNLEQIY